jgi:hypothetical protein
MKTSKIAMAFLGIIFLGATAAFAWDGSGTGAGTCWLTISDDKDLPCHFHPFAEWKGKSSGSTFSGTWVDIAHNESGTFHGNYYDPAQPPASATERISAGTWYRNVNNTSVLMGNYELHMDVCTDGDAYGTWMTTNSSWTGFGSMTGHDPNVPPPSDGE